MGNPELALIAYLRLADLSQRKRQFIGRNKFLVLAGAAACRAGWPEVAQRCRTLILDQNAVHLIGRFPTFADALRDSEFQTFLKPLDRFCSYERAEHLLEELGLPTELAPAEAEQGTGDWALAVLSGAHWHEAGSTLEPPDESS